MATQEEYHLIALLLDLETKARKAKTFRDLSQAFCYFISSAQKDAIVFLALDNKLVTEARSQTMADTQVIADAYDDVTSQKYVKYRRYDIDKRVSLWIEKTDMQVSEELMNRILEIWFDRHKKFSGFKSTKSFKWSMAAVLLAFLLIPWFPNLVYAPAEVIPGNAIKITSIVEGAIVDVGVYDNQIVKKGDTLLTLSNIEVKQEVVRLNAKKQALKASLSQTQNPSSRGYSLSKSKVIIAEIETLDAELTKANRLNDSLIIKASKDGRVRVNEILAEGAFVKKGQLILRIGDIGSSDVVIKQPLDNLHRGDWFTLFWSGKTIFQLPKKIEGKSFAYRYPEIDPYTNTFLESAINVPGLDSSLKAGYVWYADKSMSLLVFILNKAKIIPAIRVAINK